MKRPENEIANLINIIKEKNNFLHHHFSKGTAYHLNSSNSIAILHEGMVSYYNSDANIFLFQIQAPFVLGLTKLVGLSEKYYIKCETDIKISFLSSDQAYKVIDEENIWLNVLLIVCYVIHVNTSSIISNANANAYEIIKKALNEIWLIPENERSEISIFDFTMKKYQISRSSISKILKSLNEGLYIKTRRGVLIELNKLPEKY